MNDSVPWLERELTRQLAPVAAPAFLWNRIENPRQRFRRAASLRWIAWPAVAIVTLIACAGLFRRIDQTREPELEIAEFTRGSRQLDFRSGDFRAIRNWVKTEADIDVDLPEGSVTAENAPLIRLSGARLIRVKGLRMAAIDYSIGENTATLIVSGKRPGLGNNTVASRHLFSEMQSSQKARFVSWNMRNQSYTIAFSGGGDAHGACLLCHANLPGLITMN